jgi:hypothetical protein
MALAFAVMESSAQRLSEELGWRVATMHGGMSAMRGDL